MDKVTIEDITKASEELAEAFNKAGITAADMADAIQDYAALGKEYGKLVMHFKQEKRPVHLGDGKWACPKCGARIAFHHSHCHRCGQLIGWYKKKKTERKREE